MKKIKEEEEEVGEEENKLHIQCNLEEEEN